MSNYDRIVNPVTKSFYIVHDGNGNGHTGRILPGHVLSTAVEHVEWVEDPQELAYMAHSASLVDAVPDLPPEGEVVTIDQFYKWSGSIYVCYQTHNRMHFTPDETPALFGIAKEPFGEWVQPTGAHDAYNKGDKVTYNGLRYKSTIDANVWDPITLPSGWEQIPF